jgi:hypothetical protein
LEVDLRIALPKRSIDQRAEDADALLGELRDAHESLRTCFRELDKVLAEPAFDAAALVSVRLRLAGLRLTRGPLITKLSEFLVGHVSHAEEAMLAELRASHVALLQKATAHTAKWTLDAIATNWEQYRSETETMVRGWAEKAEREQRLVYPLVRRWAKVG